MRIEKWQAMFKGPASTPDFTIRVGETFKAAMRGALVCTMPATTTKTAQKVVQRAKVITAAPDMLEALKENLDAMQTYTEWHTARWPSESKHLAVGLKKMVAAIAKAEGRQQ
jgi:2-phospho-L-lactate guanylyltransferase (CobY/MobA/RfbA family)